MAIIGNRFLWDPTTGGLVGSKGQFVNTLNKEISMKEFFNEPHSNNNFDKEDGRDGADSPLDVHRPRPNVVLLGDSLGDARMTLNLEFVANVVKVRRAKKQCGEKNRDGSAHSRYPFKHGWPRAEWDVPCLVCAAAEARVFRGGVFYVMGDLGMGWVVPLWPPSLLPRPL